MGIDNKFDVRSGIVRVTSEPSFEENRNKANRSLIGALTKLGYDTFANGFNLDSFQHRKPIFKSYEAEPVKVEGYFVGFQARYTLNDPS